MRVAGVDSGSYLVEEVSAPEGYAAFSGRRAIELSATLDPDHIVHAQVQVSLKAADSLRADGFDADAGQAAVSVLDGPAGPLDAVASALPKTGDTAPLGALALLAAAALLALQRHAGGRGSVPRRDGVHRVRAAQVARASVQTSGRCSSSFLRK